MTKDYKIKLRNNMMREVRGHEDYIGYFVRQYRRLVPKNNHLSTPYIRNYLTNVFLEEWRVNFPPSNKSIKRFYHDNKGLGLEKAINNCLYAVANRVIRDREEQQKS